MKPGDEIENESVEPSDYLWDKSGKPDEEIQRLEGLLAKYRHDRPAPTFPAVVPANRWSWSRFWPMRPLAVLVPVAAMVGITVAALLFFGRRESDLTGPGWDVSRLAGTPRIGRRIVGEASGRLVVGQVLETDNLSRASLKAEGIGKIEMEPDTRLRLLTMGTDQKRIALDRGTIHAFIWSPPGQFVVDTPSAITVDLGCAYTLQVSDSGAGIVRTSLGWVGFKLNGRESFIPAGAACATRPTLGPGTPYFEDATAEFRNALARFDFEDGKSQSREKDLQIIIAQSRKRDALTLWHLLSRVDEGQRSRVYDRLKALAPPPVSVTKDGILKLDVPMLDAWWNSLGFDDISVWRRWEHSWSGGVAPTRQR